MEPIDLILRGVLAPAAVSAGLLLLLVRWRSTAGNSSGIAVAAGLIAAQYAISQWPTRLVPLEGRDWLPWIAATAVLIGALARRGPLLGVPLWLLASLALPWVLLQSYIEYNWPAVRAVLWIGALALWLAVLWFLLERTVRRRPGALVPGTLLLAGAASAVAIGLSGTALFGQLTGALAAALCPVLLWTWWRPATPLAGSLVAAALLPLFALWINGAFYAELPPAAAILLAAAPAFVLVRESPHLRRLSDGRATSLALAAVLLPLAVAVTLALLAFEPDPY